MQKCAIQAAAIFILVSCHQPRQQEESGLTNHKTIIAFGSCATQDSINLIWSDVAGYNPDVFIWLGDNIYGDSQDSAVLAEKYNRQKVQPAYQEFLKGGTKVIGTWDDHDYGADDAGKEFPAKEVSKTLLLNFLDVPKDAAVRQRPGVYQSYTYGKTGQRVKVVLLDTRWFRDSLVVDTSGNGRYMPTLKGSMLGETQWKWLEQEVLHADAEVLIIGSSIQVLANEHGWERWGAFPNQYKRLIDLLSKTNAGTTIIISGDRHHAEVSRMRLDEGWLYDITSSGMTHVFARKEVEPNEHRISPLIVRRNWALFEIYWQEVKPLIGVEIRGIGDSLYYRHRLE